MERIAFAKKVAQELWADLRKAESRVFVRLQRKTLRVKHRFFVQDDIPRASFQRIERRRLQTLPEEERLTYHV